jgi:uncharacterized protein YbaA (DUF1428 family)
MTYIDCFLAPIPRENRAAYEELAEISAQVVKEYGALRVVECWLDESGQMPRRITARWRGLSLRSTGAL